RQGKATPEQVKAAQDGLDKLDTVYDLRRQDVERQTAGPLEAYLTSIKLSAAQIRERSESLAVDELEYFRK
ncbi:hypothetical protein, partial [Klebsiella pneumoniae]|uniref:hypothetical protein n=1 Tax=Klebsiella pneumoniae TaxID=573 RepID=UPI003EE03C82